MTITPDHIAAAILLAWALYCCRIAYLSVRDAIRARKPEKAKKFDFVLPEEQQAEAALQALMDGASPDSQQFNASWLALLTRRGWIEVNVNLTDAGFKKARELQGS